MTRLRTAAAGSVLAAVSITGAGVATGPAQAAQARSFQTPLEQPGQDAAGTVDSSAASQAAEEQRLQRLRGIRVDLANAVAWGSVTRAQADAFYAQMQSRIARGL